MGNLSGGTTTITTLYTMHPVDAGHLIEVKSEMLYLGSLIIKVVNTGGHYVAIEGCHRIQAATELGLPLNFDVLDYDDIVSADWIAEHFPHGDFIPWQDYPAGEIAEEVSHQGMGVYHLNYGSVPELVSEASD